MGRPARTPAVFFAIALCTIAGLLAQDRQWPSSAQAGADSTGAVSTKVESVLDTTLGPRSTYSAGDKYRTPLGDRPLLRLTEVVAVRQASVPTRLDRQTASHGGGLDIPGFRPVQEIGAGIRLYQAAAAAGTEVQAPTVEHLRTMRLGSPRQVIDPVLVDPATGLLQISTGRILVRLRDGVSAAEYFGAELAQVESIGSAGPLYLLDLGTATAEETLQEIDRRMSDARIQYAEPDFLSETIRSGDSGQPDDPLLDRQWYLQNLHAPQAWEVTAGDPGIVIAVLDGGFDLDHPDLKENVFRSSAEVVTGLDEDANGYQDDNHGWDFVDDDNDPRPSSSEEKHGTATAGIAAAVGQNGIGVVGVAYACRFLPVRVADGQGYFMRSRLVQAIHYAAGGGRLDHQRWRGADVISISLGWSPFAACDEALHSAALQGRGGRGCPIFVSAGNGAARWLRVRITGIPAGPHTVRWTYTKNHAVSAGQDSAWLDFVVFPDAAVESFESDHLPTGWRTGGDKSWEIVEDGAGGSRVPSVDGGRQALRSGRIAHGGQSYVEVTRDMPAGSLEFLLRVSCEDVPGVWTDGVRLSVDGRSLEPVSDTSVKGLAYPASHPATVSVGSVTELGLRSDYSQYGEGLDLVAPSSGGLQSIVTTDRSGYAGYSPGNYVDGFGGTSAACPMAAAVGALILSVNPGLRAPELRDILTSSAAKVGQAVYQDGWHPEYGFGQVNAYGAILLSVPPRISAFERLPAAWQLRVDALPGQVLCLEVTSDLQTWTEVETRRASRADELFLDPATTQAYRFHRVRVAGCTAE